MVDKLRTSITGNVSSCERIWDRREKVSTMKVKEIGSALKKDKEAMVDERQA